MRTQNRHEDLARLHQRTARRMAGSPDWMKTWAVALSLMLRCGLTTDAAHRLATEAAGKANTMRRAS